MNISSLTLFYTYKSMCCVLLSKHAMSEHACICKVFQFDADTYRNVHEFISTMSGRICSVSSTLIFFRWACGLIWLNRGLRAYVSIRMRGKGAELRESVAHMGEGGCFVMSLGAGARTWIVHLSVIWMQCQEIISCIQRWLDVLYGVGICYSSGRMVYLISDDRHNYVHACFFFFCQYVPLVRWLCNSALRETWAVRLRDV